MIQNSILDFTLIKEKNAQNLEKELFLKISENLNKCINILENSNNILNSHSLKEFLHQNGISLRFIWILFIKIRNPKFLLIYFNNKLIILG